MNGKGGKSEPAGNGREASGANNDGTDREMASEMEDLEGEDISSDEDEEANSKSQPESVSKQMKKMHRRFEKVSQTIRR